MTRSHEPTRRGLGIVAALLIVISTFPDAAGANPALAPQVLVFDGPFVRTRVVELIVMNEPGSPVVVERRVANDPALANGVLVNGVAVAEIGPWTLLDGPPGPRTIYAQLLYSTGTWSPVAALQLQADFASVSRLYLDLDPRATVSTPLDMDWHDIVSTPAVPISGRAGPLGSASPTHLSVSSAELGVSLQVGTGPIVAGTYNVSESSGPVTASVSNRGVGCQAGGEFIVHEVEFVAGDLATLDADFRLSCFGAAIGGGIRYGSTRALVALDQDRDGLFWDLTPIPTATAPQTVTFTNVGTAATTLGTAALSGEAATSFAISSDGCTGRQLQVGASCTMGVRFAPVARGLLRTFLVIPDTTAKGQRRVTLTGHGVQPTTLQLAVPAPPAFGPAATQIVATITPPTTNGPRLFVNGSQGFGPTSVRLTSPDRQAWTYTMPLVPGSNTIHATHELGDYFGASEATMQVTVGTSATLTLSTVADDGVMVGETAPLIARLTTGAPLGGGVLRIRNAAGTVVASANVTGSDPSLTHTTVPALGTHPYTAEFVPPDASIQTASASFNLVAVNGPRPETTMDGTTIATRDMSVTVPFSSSSAGATFECRINLGPWNGCSSPGTWTWWGGGSHTIQVRSVRADGLKDRTPATRTWNADPNPPYGTVTIAAGAAYTRTRTVMLETPAVDDLTGVTHMGIQNGGFGSEEVVPYAPTKAWTLGPTEGQQTVTVRYRDAAGWGTSVTDTIVLDTVLPATTAPRNRFTGGATASGGLVPVTLTWTGSDTTSGIARHAIAMSTDGGAWVTLSSTLTSPSHSRALRPGHTYRFRVRAVDRAGNTGGWTAGSSFRLSAAQETSSRIRYGGTWRTSSSTSHWGGGAKYAKAAGARATLTFTGRSFAWIAPVGPTRGSARIYVNGTHVKTVSLYSATTAHRRVVYTKTWTTSASRTVVIRVVGTGGRPRVDVDALAWGS